MAKAKEPVITVSTIFAGRQTDRQAFMDLILYKRELSKSRVDCGPATGYNEATPNCGIHSGMEVTNED